MKNPIDRLFYFGVFGLGFACVMFVENYISKENTIWEYGIAGTLFIFSIVFLIMHCKIKRKKK